MKKLVITLVIFFAILLIGKVWHSNNSTSSPSLSLTLIPVNAVSLTEVPTGGRDFEIKGLIVDGEEFAVEVYVNNPQGKPHRYPCGRNDKLGMANTIHHIWIGLVPGQSITQGLVPMKWGN